MTTVIPTTCNALPNKGARQREALRLAAAGAVGVAVARGLQIRRARRNLRWGPPTGITSVGTLAVRRLGGDGPPVLLLHGMCGSNRYWGCDYDILARHSRMAVPDLLGFGRSPKPDDGYGPHEHADALASCLTEAGIDQPALVVGHSMGALVALALAHDRPELVDAIVAISPPIYASRASATRHVKAMGMMTRAMAFDPPAQAVCHWMCANREFARRLAPLLRPELPAPIARDAVDHTWHSYSQSMERLILSAAAPAWVEDSTRPIHIVAALDDPVPDISLLNALRGRSPLVSLELWPSGGHDLPLTRAAECLAVVENWLTGPMASVSATTASRLVATG